MFYVGVHKYLFYSIKFNILSHTQYSSTEKALNINQSTKQFINEVVSDTSISISSHCTKLGKTATPSFINMQMKWNEYHIEALHAFTATESAAYGLRAVEHWKMNCVIEEYFLNAGHCGGKRKVNLKM